MKKIKMGIKWKLFAWFTGFTAFILLLLWLFQIVFLDDFYKYIKINDIKNSADIISQNIDNDDLESLVNRISQNNEICIFIMSSKGSQILSSDVLMDCVIHKISIIDKLKLYKAAVDNGNEYFERFTRNGFKNKDYNEQQFEGEVPPKDKGMEESIIYAKVVTNSDNEKILILLNSTISPVSATVNTLTIQLGCISVILISIALLLSFVISKIISKPIISINNSAKVLATGNYDVKFNGKGYREIAELTETLNYASKELSKVDGLRRELIANISHDLRTPLTMITGYSEILRDIPNENTPENIQVIIDEAKRLTILVNDVLDISKLQSGSQKLKLESFNLTGAIKDVLKRYSKLVEQNDYKIDFISSEDVFVTADELRISQVIYNLLNNAITHTGKDKTVIIKQTVNSGYVKIEIIDSGEGILKDKLDYIWDRYYKIDKTHKRAEMGTGLGLSIVKSIMDLHNELKPETARYGVLSEENKGSNFWFELKINDNK